MIVLRYTRSGHFDGMAQPMRDKHQTVTDKWGFVRLFDTKAQALDEFDRIVAHWAANITRGKPELEAIHPAPCNPVCFELQPI